MNNKSCKFCEGLRDLISLKAEIPGLSIKHKWAVALVCDSYRNAEKHGRTIYHGYKLNYCPECGKNIRKDIRR